MITEKVAACKARWKVVRRIRGNVLKSSYEKTAEHLLKALLEWVTQPFLGSVSLFPYTKETQNAAKNLEQKFTFQLGTLRVRSIDHIPEKEYERLLLKTTLT